MSRHMQNMKRASKPYSVVDESEEEIYTEPDDNVSETTGVFHYLSCPRCQNKRLQEIITPGARLKQCPHCQGAWFNLNELEHALGQRLKFTWSKNEAHAEIDTNHKPLCPICQTRLVQIKSLEIPELVVWACLVCQGRWVDRNEIVKLQKRGLFSAVKEFVMRLF